MKKLVAVLLWMNLLILPLRAEYQAQDFSHLETQLPGLSPALIQMHIKLYQGYVKNTNTLLAAIKNADPSSITYGALKRRMGWEMDGMLLHEAYFQNLGRASSLTSNSPIFKQIDADFGSYDAWAKDFKATGLIRGIGWVVLYRDPKNGDLHNVWINEHDLGHIAGGAPLLVMDVWEHAYITEFGLNRAGYIDTFFENINWNIVNDRFSKAALPSTK